MDQIQTISKKVFTIILLLLLAFTAVPCCFPDRAVTAEEPEDPQIASLYFTSSDPEIRGSIM